MFEIDKKKFGAFVSELRREKGYTQKELAEKLFISDKAISKWETGVSIPDTSMLIPLAELLGVTVTELLMGERMEQNAAMDAEQVEDVVKTALTYSEEKPVRAYHTKSWWPAIYLCSAGIGCVGVFLSYQQQIMAETVSTLFILGCVFGGYFCFMTKTKLPVFYDQNRFNLYSDGVFRMNIPGVALNNSNWPHIVRICRIWSCASIAIYPVMHVLMYGLNAELWTNINLYVFLLLLLGGLFLPVYVVGRKNQ